MFEVWIIASLIFAVFSALYAMSNDWFKLNGDQAVFWRSLVTTLVLLPFLFIFEWPTQTEFYTYVAIGGILAAIADILMFQAFKEHGGAVITRMYGLRPITLFFIWPFFAPEALTALIDNPLITTGISGSLIITCIAFFYNKRSQLAYSAFRAFLPCIILFSLTDIFQKFGAEATSSINGYFIIVFMFAVIMTTTSGAFMLVKQRPFIENHQSKNFILKSSLVNAGLFISVVMTKNWALEAVINPAYFNALSIAVVAFLSLLIHRFILKKEDKANPISGFVIVLSAVLLTILVSQLPK